MFEWNEEEARLEALHHPFTAPKLDESAEAGAGPGSNGSSAGLRNATALAYDLVYNGVEIAGVSRLLHRNLLLFLIIAITQSVSQFVRFLNFYLGL